MQRGEDRPERAARAAPQRAPGAYCQEHAERTAQGEIGDLYEAKVAEREQADEMDAEVEPGAKGRLGEHHEDEERAGNGSRLQEPAGQR